MPDPATAIPQRPFNASAIARLPDEIKASIISLLNGHEGKQLALVNREWKAATEDQLWSRLHVPPRSQSGLYDMHGDEETESWRRFRQLLESHPARIRSIREMTVLLVPDALEDRLAVLKLVAPFITSWKDLYPCSDDILSPCRTWAETAQVSLAMQPMPSLVSLTVEVDGAWTLTLPSLLRMAPNLTNLHLRGYIEDITHALHWLMWPLPDKLTTLSVETDIRGIDTALLEMMVGLCDNLQTFNLKLSPFWLEPEYEPSFYFVPLLESSTIETVHLDFRNDLYDDAFCWSRALNEIDGSRSSWRTISVMTGEIKAGDTPCFPSMETFRMTTRTDREPGVLAHAFLEIRRGLPQSEFGQLPSRTTTGLASDALLESIANAQSLVLIEAGYDHIPRPFPPSGPNDISHSLNIQSFVRDAHEDTEGVTLVRCWMAVDSSLFRLSPHDFSDELPLLRVEESRGTEDGSPKYAYHFCPAYMPNDFEVPADVQLRGGTSDHNWIELTHYKGRPLPFNLLDHIYSRIEHERFPAKGQRGLTLPEHVWDLLEGWYQEVTSHVQRLGPRAPSS